MMRELSRHRSGIDAPVRSVCMYGRVYIVRLLSFKQSLGFTLGPASSSRKVLALALFQFASASLSGEQWRWMMFSNVLTSAPPTERGVD